MIGKGHHVDKPNYSCLAPTHPKPHAIQPIKGLLVFFVVVLSTWYEISTWYEMFFFCKCISLSSSHWINIVLCPVQLNLKSGQGYEVHKLSLYI